MFPLLGNRRRNVRQINYDYEASVINSKKVDGGDGGRGGWSERKGEVDETKRRGNTIRGKHDGEWRMVNQKVRSRVFFIWANQDFL